MNFGDEAVPYTRISEHKHFAPWEAERFDSTLCFFEYSRECGANDIPYYPIRLVNEKFMLEKYVDRAASISEVTFVGRLGTYSYLDMDTTIDRAMETAQVAERRFTEGETPPPFVHRPLSFDVWLFQRAANPNALREPLFGYRSCSTTMKKQAST